MRAYRVAGCRGPGRSCTWGRRGGPAWRAAVRADVHARQRDAVLRATLVAAGLRGLSLRDSHGRSGSVPEHGLGRAPVGASRLRSASAERELPGRLDRVEEGAVVRDDDERAVVAAQGRLELLDRLEVEVVRRLVEEEEVDASRACSSARCARVRSPGESVDHGRPTWSAPRPNLASSVRASTGARPVTPTNASSSGVSPCSTRSCPIVPITVVRPSSRAPRSSGSSPSASLEQRRLAAAVAAGDGEPLARDEVEVERAEREVAAPTTAPARRATRLPGARSRPRARAGAPRARTASPAARCARAAAPPGAPSSSARACRGGRPSPPPARAWLRRSSRSDAALGGAPAPARSARTARRGPRRARPRTRSSRRPTRARRPRPSSISTIRVTVRSRKARSCETTTSADSGRREEPLEPLEPVEVEIVRGLVEEEHVEAREQDRGEREPRRLAARERLDRRDRASTASPSSRSDRSPRAARDRRRRGRGSGRARPSTRRRRASPAASASAAARELAPRPPRRRCAARGTPSTDSPGGDPCSCGR